MTEDSLLATVRASQHRVLSREEERRIAVRARAGDTAARGKLIEHNQRLVFSIARKYAWSKIPLVDLIQIGNLGLIHAVDKFEPDKGFKLSTYATWWIRQRIEREIWADAGLPLHHAPDYRRLRDAVAEQPNVSDFVLGRELGISEQNVELYRHVAVGPRPLEVELEDGDVVDSELVDRNADTTEEAFSSASAEALHQALASLKTNHRRALELRYGLDADGRERTYREVGVEMGLSHERVRQLLNAGLKELRAHRGLADAA